MIDHLPEEEAPTGAHNSSNQRNVSNQSNAQNQPKKKVIDTREGLRFAVDSLISSNEFVNDVSTAFSNSRDSKKAKNSALRQINEFLRSKNTRAMEYAEIKTIDLTHSSFNKARQEAEILTQIAIGKIDVALKKIGVPEDKIPDIANAMIDEPTL